MLTLAFSWEVQLTIDNVSFCESIKINKVKQNP